jgi:hypothetical protein
MIGLKLENESEDLECYLYIVSPKWKSSWS